MNRLAQEKSPYLLQHKDNPVWWQPWDASALEQARLESKPIFLSIGYSTCHWCHVMEHESFEDAEVAELLNTHFVPIKVDREERPDLDDVYMNAVQQMTGHGGWPMSVWLTPDGKPFFGGTYFPKISFAKLLERIHGIWESHRERLEEDAQRVYAHLETVTRLPEASGITLRDSILKKFVMDAERLFEPKHGGFGGAPKFPQAMMLMTLMRISRRMKDPTPEEWIIKTLEGMHRGGLYDHLAGGFHRYSTDDLWLVPHFEKMLYDNALLALTYTEAFQYFGDLEYARVTRETLDYLSREMTHPDGGFYSAQDADSLDPQEGHRQEGFFATFSYQELQAELKPEELEILAGFYNVTPEGHFEGRNILHLAHGRSRDEKHQPELAQALAKLTQVRARKPAPHLDDKVITEWNGLAIGAFAKASQVLEEPRYLKQAKRAAEFCLQWLRSEKGELWRRYREGEAGIEAFADDYAALIFGLLNLYEADFDPRWLNEAIRLQDKLDRLFWDPGSAGYFRDSGRDPSLMMRVKDDYDGVTPTANSLSAQNLLRLHALTLNSFYKQRAESIFSIFGDLLNKAPLSLAQMTAALDFYLDEAKEIAVVYPSASQERLKDVLRALRVPFFPNQVVAAADSKTTSDGPPLVQNRKVLDDQVTVYICQGHTCQAPLTDVRAIERAAGQIAPLRD